MRTLAATTQERAARALLAPVSLVRLTTWADRAAATVDRRFYFSQGPGARFQWAGDSAANHHPLVAAISDLEVAVPHLPSGLPQDLPDKPLRIDLANLDFEGERLAKVLRDHTLENATVELAQVLLDRQDAAPFQDLTAEDSIVLYRGRVRRWGPISDQRVPLACTFEFPSIEWRVATDASQVDPLDRGRRYPRPYGAAPRVPAIGRIVGWVTTLAEKLGTGTITTLEVSDATGLPTTGRALVGTEVFTWSGKTGNELTGVSRGVGGSFQAFHAAGEALVEVTDAATYSLSGVAASAIGDVFVRNPFNGEVVRVTTSFTKTPGDTTVDGVPTAILEFTAAELEELVAELSQSTEVTEDVVETLTSVQKPVYLRRYDGSTLENHWADWASVDGVTDDEGRQIDSSETMVFGFYQVTLTDEGQRVEVALRRQSGSGDYFVYLQPTSSRTDANAVQIATGTLSSGTALQSIDVTEADLPERAYHYLRIETDGNLTIKVHDVQRRIGNAITETAATRIDAATFSSPLGASEIDARAYVHDGAQTTAGNSNTSGGGREIRVDLDDGIPADTDWIIVKVHGGYGSSGQSGTTPTYTDAWDERMELRLLDEYLSPSWSRRLMVLHGGFNPSAAGGDDEAEYVFHFDPRLAEGGSAMGAKAIAWRPTDRGLNHYLSEIEVIYVTVQAPAAPSVEVASANVGYGLRFFSDVDGPLAPAATPLYKAGTGSLIKAPADVLRHLIEEVGDGAIDSDSYDDLYDALQVSSVPIDFAGDLRPLGLTWREVAARVAYEAGCNLVPAETDTETVWKMLAPDADGDFPASVATITEWEPGGFVELGRDVEAELLTRLLYLYDLDPSVEAGGDGAFRGALRASPVSADHDLASPTAAEIEAVEDTLGRLDAAEPRFYHLLRTAADAGFIAGRELSDRLRIPRLVAMSGVPWWQGYALEWGDIVQATPPWESTALKLRLIGVTKRFDDELVDLVSVEVT